MRFVIEHFNTGIKSLRATLPADVFISRSALKG
jgi:hypothetical protein